ncbi:MAG: hypothetical protein ACREXY_00485 [Gammaproteobacteria bacterium]
MRARKSWPPLDAVAGVILVFIFSLSEDEIDSIGHSSDSLHWDDDLIWDGLETTAFVTKILQALNIPSDPDNHQQPHDFVRLFPLPLRSDQSNLEGRAEGQDTVLNRVLFVLWIVAADKIIRQLQELRLSGDDLTQEALNEIRLVSLKLIYYFGDSNARRREILLEQVCAWSDWFTFTAGCFDLHSGCLVDRERAAARDFQTQTVRLRCRRKPASGCLA